jgi:hypothetical protein
MGSCLQVGSFIAPLHLAYISCSNDDQKTFNEKFLYFEKTSNYLKQITRLSITENLIPEIESFKLSHSSQYLFG